MLVAFGGVEMTIGIQLRDTRKLNFFNGYREA